MSLELAIGKQIFSARLRHDLAPVTCAHFERLSPYRGKLIHARWSGEALWSPLISVWPRGLILASESATTTPAPGQILLFAGELSEPELLVAYGTTRFACEAGSLAGNLIAEIENGHGRLAELGRQVLWQGAVDLCVAASMADRG